MADNQMFELAYDTTQLEAVIGTGLRLKDSFIDTLEHGEIATVSTPLSVDVNKNLSIAKSNTSTDGYISKDDWNIFNNKQTAGSYLTSSDLTPYATTSWVGQQGFLTGITSLMVMTALTFTPYNATNPAGYITSAALSGYATTRIWPIWEQSGSMWMER